MRAKGVKKAPHAVAFQRIDGRNVLLPWQPSTHRFDIVTPLRVTDSVGVVISQDGDVRAMSLVGNTLVVGENVMLCGDEFDAGGLASTQ
jgi:hypothetical protein